MVAVVLRPTTVSDDPSRKLTLESARRELQDMEQWLESAEARTLPLHELEQESRMREVNRLFLKSHLESRAAGATPAPIPEPTTMALTALGLAGAGVAARRRRKQGPNSVE